MLVEHLLRTSARKADSDKSEIHTQQITSMHLELDPGTPGFCTQRLWSRVLMLMFCINVGEQLLHGSVAEVGHMRDICQPE